MLISLIVRLTDPTPYDLPEVDLTEYKGIILPWNDWDEVTAQCRRVAVALVDRG